MNSRLLSNIDRSLTVIESLFNRVIERVFIYPYESYRERKGIRNSNKGNRFGNKTAQKEAKEYQKIPDFLDDHPGFLQESHEHGRLVTSPMSTAPLLDADLLLALDRESERRMDTAPRPPRLRKPPKENAVHFSECNTVLYLLLGLQVGALLVLIVVILRVMGVI